MKIFLKPTRYVLILKIISIARSLIIHYRVDFCLRGTSCVSPKVSMRENLIQEMHNGSLSGQFV